MYSWKGTKRTNVVFALLSLALSVLMLHSWATFDGIPPRAELKLASGTVDWVQRGKYGVKFRLDGVSQSFDYASKGRGMGVVYDTLSRSGRTPITVLFDSGHPGGPIFTKDKYYGVFELSVAGKPFRSYDEIDQAWRSDETVGAWLGIAFFLSGVFLAYCAVRNSKP